MMVKQQSKVRYLYLVVLCDHHCCFSFAGAKSHKAVCYVVFSVSNIPCVGQLAEIPADFRNWITCSDASYLSINRPLLGNDDRLTFQGEKKSTCLKHTYCAVLFSCMFFKADTISWAFSMGSVSFEICPTALCSQFLETASAAMR